MLEQKKKKKAMRSKELSVDLRDCDEAQIWGREPKIFCSFGGPEAQWLPSFIHVRSSEPQRLFQVEQMRERAFS